nr:uncharacterized protein LOC124495440 [Dermatophagoides farinae]
MIRTRTKVLRKLTKFQMIKKSTPQSILKNNEKYEKEMMKSSSMTMKFIPISDTDTPSRHICCRCKHQRIVHNGVGSKKIQLQTTATRKDEEIIQSINDGKITLHSFLLLSPHIQGRIRREWLRRNNRNIAATVDAAAAADGDDDDDDDNDGISPLIASNRSTSSTNMMMTNKLKFQKMLNLLDDHDSPITTSTATTTINNNNNKTYKKKSLEKTIKTRIPICKSRVMIKTKHQSIDDDQAQSKKIKPKLTITKKIIPKHSYNLRCIASRAPTANKNDNSSSITNADCRLPIVKTKYQRSTVKLPNIMTRIKVKNTNNHNTHTSTKMATTRSIVTRAKTKTTTTLLKRIKTRILW